MNGLTIFSQLARMVSLARSRNFSSSAVANTSSNSFAARQAGRAVRTRLPDKPARTRFAPSPTGYLHLGSLRTALYNYLLARATHGQFVLRLEDTDQSRIVPDAETRLYEDMKWSGLSWDEGPDCGGYYGPYKQSERLPIYNKYADRLLQEGKAFRCFCSHDDMTAHRQKDSDSDGTFGLYPGACLSVSADESAERAAKGEAHTVRFRSNVKPVTVYDVVYGLYRKKLPEDHFIIMKSDGFPTYHFANVVDDHLMDITHVVRGAEWLISTAKHVSLYDAFGWTPPEFAHVGLLVDSNRQKLSKRNMDIGIDSYKRDGILPPALLNFAALLGWNPGSSSAKGVMTLEDMTKRFDLKFTKGDIVVNAEKLAFFQKKHIRLALDDTSTNNSLIDEYLTTPVLKMARETETRRLQSSIIGTARGSLEGKDFVYSLGEPIVQLSRPTSDPNCDLAHRQIRAMLRISRCEAISASGLVEANKYLIWRPPAQQIRESYTRFSNTLGSIFVEETPASITEVFDLLIDQLDQIGDAQWTTGVVQSTLGDAVNRIQCYNEGKNRRH